MGNLLIVDDELDILISLEELFKYESNLDIDVYTAKSATAAVKLLEKIKFDVVMTDIKMPRMNGIQLYKLIKENWPKCRVIFLTGFRDFDDLYEINTFKDVRYFQKSEDNNVLITAVSDAFKEIENMMFEERSACEQQAQIHHAEIVLRRNVMREYFWNTGRAELTTETANRINLPVSPDKNLFIFLLRIDQYEEKGVEEDVNREMVLSEIIDEFLPIRFKHYLYCDFSGCCLLFLQPMQSNEDMISARKWEQMYGNLLGTLEYIQEKALMSTRLSISFVTCNERCFLKDGVTYLNRLRQEAAEKIGDGVQLIVSAASHVQKITGFENKIPVNLQLQVKELEQNLDRKAFAEFTKRLHYLTNLLYLEKVDVSVQKAELYYSVDLVFVRYININHMKYKIESGIPLDRLLRMEAHDSMQEAAEYLTLVANRIIEEADIRGAVRSIEVLDKVKQYIDSHLAEDLTLVKLAQICYLNPSYLSRVFKQKYDCTLTEYIGSTRLERAKYLLRTTSEKVSDIAVKVGYFSVPSFTRIFKKSVGVSPLEYRDHYGESNYEI